MLYCWHCEFRGVRGRVWSEPSLSFLSEREEITMTDKVGRSADEDVVCRRHRTSLGSESLLSAVSPRLTKKNKELVRGTSWWQPQQFVFVVIYYFFVWLSNKRVHCQFSVWSWCSFLYIIFGVFDQQVCCLQCRILREPWRHAGCLSEMWFCVVLKCFSFGKTAKCLFWDILSRGWCQVQEGFLSPLFSVWALNIARATAESQFGRF